MKKHSTMNITISSTPRRFLSLALTLTLVCFLGFIVFSGYNSSNIDPIKIKLIQAIQPLLWCATIYYYYQYIQAKKYTLTITDREITWGSNKKPTMIVWTDIHSLCIIDLAEISRQSGLVYEFTTKNYKNCLAKPTTLFDKDYAISDERLLAIFQRQAEQHNFILKG